MGKKVIAIGNEMMRDDGVGISVAKGLEDYLKTRDIELIIGETDVEYCLDNIEDEDDLIILDAAFEEDAPGTINLYSLVKLLFNRTIITQHQPSLLEAIRVYKMGVKGILITIEVAEISFGLGISERMKGMLPQIVEEIRKLIDDYIGG
ncbi:MAG: hydrogenase maturation protease [Clostridiaceae bacterium]